MRILIFEPNLTGHHGPYLRHLIGGLVELGQRPTVVTRWDARRQPELGIHIGDIAELADFDTSVEVSASSPRRLAAAYVACLEAALVRHTPEHVWIPYADGMAQVLGARALALRSLKRPLGCELEGLLFRGGFAYENQRRAKRIEYRLSRFLTLRAGWSVLHLLDPLPYEQMPRANKRVMPRISLMPDPVEPVASIERIEARRQLGLPEEGRYTCCAGRLDRRKGVHLLLAAFQAAQSRLSPTDRLLLAGPLAPDARVLLEHEYGQLLADGRILLIDRVLSVEKIVLALSAADVISTPYPNHIGSASFVIRAAAVGRPVLGSDFGWIGHVVPRFRLGWTCQVYDIEAFAAALVASLERAAAWRPSDAAERFIDYHSPENFQAHWTARLRVRLGEPPHPRLFPWSAVTENTKDS
jgi:glycosyltransferase involved in cell wall biosynthesis